jgi:hypothetical protein
MRPESYKTDFLLEQFQRERVLSLEEVIGILGGPSRATAFRKLSSLGSRASYSHKGKFHTLDSIARYDKKGLWSYRGIRFSQYGSLLNTIKHLVEYSTQGYFSLELQELLQVRVFNALAQLHASEELQREQLGREYLYLSVCRAEEQLANRHTTLLGHDEEEEDISENMRMLLSVLNEKQQRLYLGLESLKLGWGGDVRISRMSGVNVKTIARGRRELLAKDISCERIRRPGAGRPSMKKKRNNCTAE